MNVVKNCVAIRSVRNKILVEKRLKFRQRAVRYATKVGIFNYITCLTARRFDGMAFLPICYPYGNFHKNEMKHRFVKTRFYLVLPILTGSTCRNRRHEVEPRANGELKKCYKRTK